MQFSGSTSSYPSPTRILPLFNSAVSWCERDEHRIACFRDGKEHVL